MSSGFEKNYASFDCLNGDHPWRDAAPDGFVDYEARFRSDGRVLYFNFDLARELGLIAHDHPYAMNEKLETKILQTFSLQIINEYDLAHPKKLGEIAALPKPFMATRYLQIQHKDKCGRTSGDGRSIWNGCIEHNGKIFDVSSRGTGATILSPGATEANRPLKTGEAKFGYASGTADLDEMLGSAMLSEIFYKQGIPTERCLTVIDYGNGEAIGVRTAPNLIRPAHLFRFLKMGKHAELKKAWEYFFNRQAKNGTWKLPAEEKARHALGLEFIARSYGKLAAVLQEEYIFHWLAWDGDNVLADGSILDYGSIRQFSARHDKYRYEDADRFSTSLSEQKRFARIMVQVFAQGSDFILTGAKKNLRYFKTAKCLEQFDHEFETECQRRMLSKIGFDKNQLQLLVTKHRKLVMNFRRGFEYFEGLKIAKGPEKLPDGVDHPPVFLIRNILRELPKFLPNYLEPQRFCAMMAASYSTRRDLRITPLRALHAMEFQSDYLALCKAVGGNENVTLSHLSARAEIINHPHHMTGNGLVGIVEEILEYKVRMDWRELQSLLDSFIDSQVLLPEKWKPIPDASLRSRRLQGRLLRKINLDLELYKETV